MHLFDRRTSAIVAAYNEAERLHTVLDVLVRCPSLEEVIVVDDGSTDLTAAVAATFPGITVVHLPTNRGKGGALEEGVRLARGRILCFVDADLIGLTCAHICRLVRSIQIEGAAMAVGGKGRSWRPRVRFLRRFRPNLSGERALHRGLWYALPAEYRRGYKIETALNVYCRRAKLPVVHVPMPEVYHVIKEVKWGVLRGTAVRLASMRDLLLVRLSLALRRRRWPGSKSGMPVRV